MPAIARFRGIVIRMYYEEHGTAHVHAVHGEHEVSVDVKSGIVRGSFPMTPLRDVLVWAEVHKAELLRNWELARLGKPMARIAPLE